MVGFSLDAWLRLEVAAGTYQVVIGSVTRRGGRDNVYRLEIAPPTPGFNASIAANAFSIAPGKTNDMKVTVTRLNGFEGQLTLEARDLPVGVTAAPVAAPAKSGDVTLQLIAATNAPSHNGPLRLVLLNTADKRERPVPHPLTSSAENNGVPGGYTDLVLNETSEHWLSVVPEKPSEPAKVKSKK